MTLVLAGLPAEGCVVRGDADVVARDSLAESKSRPGCDEEPGAAFSSFELSDPVPPSRVPPTAPCHPPQCRLASTERSRGAGRVMERLERRYGMAFARGVASIVECRGRRRIPRRGFAADRFGARRCSGSPVDRKTECWESGRLVDDRCWGRPKWHGRLDGPVLFCAPAANLPPEESFFVRLDDERTDGAFVLIA